MSSNFTSINQQNKLQIQLHSSSRIGVELNFISIEDYKSIENKFNLIDYWLFDDAHLFLMRYSPEGEFLGLERSDDNEILKEAVKMKNQSFGLSKTLTYVFEKYLAIK